MVYDEVRNKSSHVRSTQPEYSSVHLVPTVLLLSLNTGLSLSTSQQHKSLNTVDGLQLLSMWFPGSPMAYLIKATDVRRSEYLNCSCEVYPLLQ